MRKRILSLLTCAAVLFGIFPVVPFADETGTQNAAKFGIENGDTVIYAGIESPISWHVIDAEKTNTDDTNGLLLLSKNGEYEINYKEDSIGMSYALDRFKNLYKSYYDKNFDGNSKSAVMTVSKASQEYTYNSKVFNSALENDTVFALSIEETEKTDPNIRKFHTDSSTGSDWWVLRSVHKGKGLTVGIGGPKDDPDLATVVAQSGKISTSHIANYYNHYFRPAVNIDKTKLAGLDSSPLLLPAGEFKEAEYRLAALNTASEWKLSTKNNVNITTAYSSDITENRLKICVATDLEEVGDNDYISVIIRKKDGSISHYGRYQMSGTGAVIYVTFPSGIDMDNDSMYVFYENYRGEFSGSVSALKKVCLKHDLEYKIADEGHDIVCKNCDYSLCGDHYTREYQSDDIKHTGTCDYCGYVITGEHKYTDKISETKTDFTCQICKRHTFTALNGDFDRTVAVLRDDEFTPGSAKVVKGSISDADIDINKLFEQDEKATVFDPSADSGKAVISFKTNRAVKATGIKLQIKYSNNVPSAITLYGRNSDSEDYRKIAYVPVKQVLDLNFETFKEQKDSYLFADTASLAPYSDYEIEFESDSSEQMQVFFFGLLSEPGPVMSFTGKGAVAKGVPGTVYHGIDSSFTVFSKNGHPKKDDIKVTADGAPAADSIWSYSEESGIFTLLGEYIDKSVSEYNVSAECADTEVQVETELTGLSFTGSKTTEFGHDYTGTFTDSYGGKTYTPSKKDIKVLCNETDITGHCTLEDGKLVIPYDYILGSTLRIIASEAGLNRTDASSVRIERSGKPTRWYDSVLDSLRDISSGGDMTVTFIGNENYLMISDAELIDFRSGKVTLDLNGKTINCSRYAAFTVMDNADVTIKNGTVNASNTAYSCRVDSDSGVLTVCNSSIEGIDVNGGRLIADNSTGNSLSVYMHNNGNFLLKKGTVNILALEKPYNIKIAGGTVKNTYTYDDDPITYSDFLADGCEYYDITDAAAFADGKPTGFSVKCSHINADGETGRCTVCGHLFNIKAANGETVKYYDSITDAITYANENPNTVIKLNNDITVNSAQNFRGENTTLDLNGKTFTVSGDFAIYTYGSMTVNGNGIIDAKINASSGMLTIENGEFKQNIGGYLVLNGGKFSYIVGENVKKLLGKGKAYQKADGTFITDANDVSDVTVTDAPFVITKQPNSKIITDTSVSETISVEVSAGSGYEDAITYQWYEDKMPLEGCTSPQMQLPANHPIGTQKKYKCVVSCKGYDVSTDYALYTFGNVPPILEYDSDSDKISVNAYGRECVLAVAAYQGDKLLDIKTKDISAQDGKFTTNLLGVNIYGADCIKVFLWDGIDTMTPIADPIIIANDNIFAGLTDTDFIASSEGVECSVIIAKYNGEKLIDFKSMRLDGSNDYEIYLPVSEIGLNKDDSTEIKYFVWDNLQSMKPLRFSENID